MNQITVNNTGEHVYITLSHMST